MLKVDAISKKYFNFRAIDNVSFCVDPATINVVMGPNGAGKSTIAKIICGIEGFDSGLVTNSFKNVNYLPQGFSFNSYMPLDCMSFYKYVSGENIISDSVVLGLIQDFCNLDSIANREVYDLSGGAFRKLLISAVLSRKSDFLVLDEPTQNLDIASEILFYEMILKMRDMLGVAFLIISHDLHTVLKHCDKVICIHNHVCCSGSPVEMSTREEFFSLYKHNHNHTH